MRGCKLARASASKQGSGLLVAGSSHIHSAFAIHQGAAISRASPTLVRLTRSRSLSPHYRSPS